MSSWDVLDSQIMIDRWWMRLRVEHVRLPGGSEIPEFHVVEYPDWALVVARTEDNRYVMVEQYRHGIGRSSLEFPAGMIEPGEAPGVAARRELVEETGLRAAGLEKIGAWSADPSRQTEFAHAFYARDIRKVSAPCLDETENLVQKRLSLNEIHLAIADGSLVHGMHVAAFYRALHSGLIESDSDRGA